MESPEIRQMFQKILNSDVRLTVFIHIRHLVPYISYAPTDMLMSSLALTVCTLMFARDYATFHMKLIVIGKAIDGVR